MIELVIFAAALVTTFLGVELFRRWSLWAGLLDFPNFRSSHAAPTPRGGGIVVVIVTLSLYTYTTVYLTSDFKWYYVASAGLVALVSWLDDLYSLSSAIRLLCHAAAAAILILGCGFWPDVSIPGVQQPLHVGFALSIFAFVWLIWMTNAYNFMDGIDGIAGSQAAVAGFAWMILGNLLGYDSAYYFGGVIAFSSLGFLIHNWSPAKVFMGDVGSAFLGFTFAAMPLLYADAKPENSFLLFLAGIAFVWFFLFDAVLTMARRALRGERVWIAHREHLYQRMVIGGKTHGFVSVLYTLFAAIVAVVSLVGIIFRGNFVVLTLFTVVVLSAALVFITFKKRIDAAIGKC